MNKKRELNLCDLVAQITSQTQVEEIYHWVYHRNSKHYNMLQVHVNNCGDSSLSAARQHCASLVKELQNVFIIVCYAKDIQSKITLGLARAHLICQPHNLIYQHPEVEVAMNVRKLSVSQVVKQHNAYLTKELSKIRSFEDGYHFYCALQHPEQSAFMLHQMLELSLRLAQDLLVGKDKRTHCLRTLQDCLKRYDSTLGNLYGKQQEEQEALSKLDEAYAGMRYQQGYEIDPQTIQKGYEVAAQVLQWVEAYRLELEKEISENLNARKKRNYKFEFMKKRIETVGLAVSDHKQAIVDLIKAYGDIASVHCFSYRSDKQQLSNLMSVEQHTNENHHYYLLIGYEALDIAHSDLQGRLTELLPDNINLTLIVENKWQIEQHSFYRRTIEVAESWYTSETIGDYRPQADTPRPSAEKRIKQWQVYYKKAAALCTVYAKELIADNKEIVCHTTALALEQACLGLLRYYWQYVPNDFNLNHLMDLCELISPEATEVFIRNNQQQRAVFMLLAKSQHEFRHNKSDREEAEHTYTLLQRVRLFIEIANNQVMASLKEAA